MLYPQMCLSAAHAGGASHAVLGLRMISQDLAPGLDRAGDPIEDGRKGAWVAASFLHQTHSIKIGGRLDLPGIGRLHHRLCRDHHHAATSEVAQQHPEQKRQAGGLQQRACAVAVCDMADLVRDDASEFVWAP
jgi:hypothetical protein